ncbi:MAG: hypothetical protein OEZ20_03740 [candidate division WOR-3 bacterium]|nr:hypothetical protein [candidate division WOR-3 bacterium]
MRRCPECGEPVLKGQTHCFACGSDFILTPAKSQFFKGSTVFVIAIIGGSIIALVLALLIARPKPESEPKKEVGVQYQPKTQKTPTSPSKAEAETKLSEVDRMAKELSQLEFKLNKIATRARTEQFNKDEQDAFRFSQALVADMKLLLQTLKNVQSKEDQKKIIRQFRSKQNEVSEFLFILKNRL